MTLFYKRAIEDRELGPFFTNELGEDLTDEEWVEHIDLLADFWLAEILGQDTYYGNVIGAHDKLPRIHDKIFAIWLKLFSQTADEVYTSELATRFKEKAAQLAERFMTHMRKTKLKSSEIFQIKS